MKYLISVICLVFLWACSDSNKTAGTGTTSDVPNAITLSVKTEDGKPAARVAVYVRSADYQAQELSEVAGERIPDGWTDEHGVFLVPKGRMESQQFLVEFQGANSGSVLKCAADGCDSMSSTLAPYASIQASLQNSSNGEPLVGYVQVIGLERMVVSDAMGVFEIDNVPAGEYRLRIVPLEQQALPFESSVIELKVGKTQELEPIEVEVPPKNTSQVEDDSVAELSTGAARTDTLFLPLDQDEFWDSLANFPLLVRLGAEYSFEGSQDDGSDIRAYSQQGKQLPVKIVSWDKSSRLGVLWILVDTLPKWKNSRILLQQGGTPGPQASDDMYVEEAGFAGVWDGESSFKNLVSGKTCSQKGSGGVTHEEGVIEQAYGFDGNSWLECEVMDLNSDGLSLSAWVRIDEEIPEALFVGQQDDSAPDGIAYSLNQGEYLRQVETRVSLNGEDGHLKIYGEKKLGEWVLISLLWGDGYVRGRHNGNSNMGTSRWVSADPYTPGTPLVIGGGEGFTGLIGAVDEVRFVRGVQSQAWAWLQYLTEHPEADFVELRTQ